ncbi:MAG: GntR family transcriptional regulator [Candidatus Dormibacteraeota bacterium]|nr:GntR family transcriptional regulator [Candidatus Dormibacteraeota bacterium]
MLFEVDSTSAIPLYAQIAAAVRRAIAEQRVKQGVRLPPTRDLAQELSVNVHTVQRAYGLLRDEGLVHLRQGRGAVVAGGDVQPRAQLHGLAQQLLAEARTQGLTLGDVTALLEGMR